MKYSALRKKFLEDRPFCEAKLEGCTRVATDLHHSRGRGIYFLDLKTFKAMCANCHGIVERKPKMAKKKGLSKSRLTKSTK